MSVGKEVNNNFYFIKLYFLKMKGEGLRKPTIKLGDSIISAAGGLIAMTFISIVSIIFGFPMILGPMGASCFLVFAAHEGFFSQPRQIFGGHMVSTIVALAICDVFGKSPLTISVTLAVVLFLMISLKLVHPPGAASAMVAINTQIGWGFLFVILLCSIILIAVSVFYNNLFKHRQYPKQW